MNIWVARGRHHFVNRQFPNLQTYTKMRSTTSILRTVSAAAAAAFTCGHAANHSRTDYAFSDNDNNSDNHYSPSPIPWIYGLLVSESDVRSKFSSTKADTYHTLAVQKPEEKPGKVLAWGGIFGRSPTYITPLGDRIVCAVAASNGLGAAVDEQGNALIFSFDPVNQQYNFQPTNVPLSTPVCKVTWRDAHNQAIFLDTKGDLFVIDVKKNERTKQIEYVKSEEIKRIDIISEKSNKLIQRRERINKISCSNSNCISLSKDGQAFISKSFDKNLEFKSINLQNNNETLVDVACSDEHIVVLNTKGEIYTYGNDQWIQLGRESRPWNAYKSSSDKTNIKQTFAKAKLFGENSIGSKVIAGKYHTGLLNRDGSLFTCGFNQFGQLGHHNYTTFAPPCPISDFNLKVSNCVAGAYHTCIIDYATGAMKCIGGNEFGQLGNGTLQNSSNWKKVKFNRKAIKPYFIYAGNHVTVAIV